MNPSKIKAEIEAQFLTAMDAIDEANHLIGQLPTTEDHDCLKSNLIDMKSKLKYFLNKRFDKLARQRS